MFYYLLHTVYTRNNRI